MAKTHSVTVGAIGCSLLLASFVGCVGEIARANDSNIKRLSNLYLAYQMKHNWNGPKNEEKFKEFIRSVKPEKLQRIGIDPGAIDDLFVSSRDNEPFKIRFSVKGSAMGSAMGSAEPGVFEATGVEGARMVGFLNMQTRAVDESEYNQLWEGKGVPDEPLRGSPP